MKILTDLLPTSLSKKTKPKPKVKKRERRMPEPHEGVSHVLDISKELPPEILKIAMEQGEDSERTCLLVQELRDMIYEKGECTPHRMDDDYLIKFLRARYWKVENAYKLICRYYAFRDANQEYHVGVHPMALRSLGDEDVISVTPYTDQNGRRMLTYKIGNWRPSKVPMNDLFRATLVLMEIGSLEPKAQVLGGVGIFDLEGLTLNHAWYMSPSIAQKIISFMVTSMPIRTTSIHILNQGWAFDAVYQMFKPFMNERMRERLFIHGSNYSSLHKHIDPKHLPVRYGGEMPEYPYTYWMDNLSRNDVIVKELEQLGYIWDPEELEE